LTSGPLPATLRLLCEDLDAYFAGQRPNFRAPLAWQQGTDFQREVWRALTKIPYGQTRTYHDVSVMTGRPQAQRAVGQANNKNPWPLVVPCHRVVAANGLGGYAGHEDLKAWLLDFEQRT
jgi:methylated-DNA-[protein]-cysteine S-methyltransferase